MTVERIDVKLSDDENHETSYNADYSVHPFVDHKKFYVLQIGITEKCNLMCLHCPRYDESNESYKLVEYDDFVERLSRFSPKNFNRLLVSDFGEVTMVKTFLDYLRAAKRLGWNTIEFVTNGTVSKESYWDTMIQEDLVQSIILSTEAGSQELFETIRGFSWDRFLSATKAIMAAKRKYQRDNLSVCFNAVCLKENINEFPKIVELAGELGLNYVTFVHLNPTAETNEDKNVKKWLSYSHRLDTVDRHTVLDVWSKVLEVSKNYNIPVDLPERYPELEDSESNDQGVLSVTPASTGDKPNIRCPHLFNWIQVAPDGGVFPCCQMSRRWSVGNIDEQDFSDMWRGPRYSRLINGLIEGGEPIDVCKQCNVFAGKRF